MNAAGRRFCTIGGLALAMSLTVLNGNAQQVTGASLVNVQPGSGEKFYVHTDKSTYLAGEIIWFRLYYLEAGSWEPLDLSRVAYVELLDRASKPVLQSKIEMGRRGGSGSFYIPASLVSDRYVLRAYTRWGRNFGSEAFFEAPVSVLNTVAGSRGDASALQQPKIHFYPEGGQLLSGAPAVVGFRVADEQGMPIDVNGIITGPQGDTVGSFASHKFGIGRITLSAAAGERYTAHFTIGDRTYTQELPGASNRGYGLQVTDGGNDILEVRIRLLGLDLGAETMQLVAHSGNEVLSAQQMSAVNNQQGIFNISKSKLKEGVNYVTLFNQRGEPVCERLVFKKPASALKANVAAGKAQYKTREKVDLSIEVPALQADTDSISYSVSVYQSGPWEGRYQAGMISYRWLLPYLQGEVIEPEYYFSDEPGVAESVDNLLLTHGWRSFGNNPAAKPAGQRLTPELKGHLITGRVVRKSDDSPVPGELCYLSAPSYSFDLESARSDRQGIVYFEVDRYFGPGEIVVKAASDSAAFFRVDILNPFAEEKLKSQYFPLVLNKDWTEALQARSIAMQAQNIYRADSLRKFGAPLYIDTLPFYGRPEYTYKMDDYKRFTTMEEVLREFVIPISVASRGGKLHLAVIDELYKRSYDENVMVLVDGIPLTDHNKIFSYDPLKVKKLDVVTRRYVLGSASVGGIASFETYDGRFDAFDIDPAVILVDYEGLQLQREFYSPDYSVTNNPRIPDFRNTLFWKPNTVQSIGQKGQLSFYTGDQKGLFKIVLQGITDSGKICTAETELVVD